MTTRKRRQLKHSRKESVLLPVSIFFFVVSVAKKQIDVVYLISNNNDGV